MSIFLGLGANIGNRLDSLNKATDMLTENPYLNLIKQSKIYETSPMDFLDQSDFLNKVIEINFSKSLIELFTLTQNIEKKMGRDHNKIRYQPRVIDIDILSFNDIIINSDKLIVPHPKIKFRKFVLKPWTDIASDYILPNSKMTIKQHLDKISDLDDEIREYN